MRPTTIGHKYMALTRDELRDTLTYNRDPLCELVGGGQMNPDVTRAVAIELLGLLQRRDEELEARREAMEAIFWLNLAPPIDEICTQTYQAWKGKNETLSS